MTLRSTLKVALAIAATVFAVGIALFGWLRLAPRHVPAGQPPLTTIEAASLPAIRDAFNAHQGTVRILAMLSPT